MKKVLVSGASGFIGSHLVRTLVKKGYHVFGVTTNTRQSSGKVNYIKIDSENCDFEKIVLDVQPDCIINAAGSPSVGFAEKQPELDNYLNYEIAIRLIAGFKALKNGSKFIQLSSAAVYGSPTDLPISESSISSPISNYGKSKRKVEVELENLYSTGLDIVNLRLFSVYGPGIKKQLFWDIYEKARSERAEIGLFGTGKETRDFIYIDDVISVILNLMETERNDKLHLNVCSGNETKISQAAKILVSLLSSQKKIIFNNQVKAGDPMNWCGSIKRLEQFKPESFKSLEDGLLEYVKWLEQRS